MNLKKADRADRERRFEQAIAKRKTKVAKKPGKAKTKRQLKLLILSAEPSM
jgi:hypothetical protein